MHARLPQRDKTGSCLGLFDDLLATSNVIPSGQKKLLRWIDRDSHSITISVSFGFFSVARAGKSGHFADTLSSGLIQNLAIEAEFLHHFFVSSFWPKSFRREKPDFLAARLLRE